VSHSHLRAGSVLQQDALVEWSFKLKGFWSYDSPSQRMATGVGKWAWNGPILFVLALAESWQIVGKLRIHSLNACLVNSALVNILGP
jgi:hypothetical protein